jgi:hypothetical protein
MSKAGYWNVRVTPSLRASLDHVAALMGPISRSDIDVVRFALSFTTAMLPAPITNEVESLAELLAAIEGDLNALRVYDETYPTAVRLMSEGMVARVRDSQRGK